MVTIEQARQLALSLPEVIEQPHFQRASFRVGKKIVATLDETGASAVLKLNQEDLEIMVAGDPITFSKTSWSHQGWVAIDLNRIQADQFEALLWDVWRRVAPKKLVKSIDSQTT